MTTTAPDLPPPHQPTIDLDESLGTAVAVPATPRLLWLALAAGILCDLALRSGGASVGGALFVGGMAAALIASGRLRTRESQLFVMAAPLFGSWLALRTSDWLLPLDVLAAVGLLTLGAGLASGGSLFDLTLPAVAQRACVAILHGVRVPAFLEPTLRTGLGRLGATRSLVPAARGLVLAVPVLLVLGGLLASADAVFASVFRVDVDGPNVLLHAVLIVTGAWMLLAMLRIASAEPLGPRPPVRACLGRPELSIVLGSVVLLFGGFAASQLLALSDGGRHVVDTAGLTYAEYARSGFFQLLWVAALTVALLLGLRALVGDDEASRHRFRWLALVVVGLTLVIVVVAIRRLGLYQEAFGLTMLRLYCTIFAVWIGAVIVGLGATIAGLWAHRSWLPGAAVLAGLAGLLVLNVANPEAIVARHNLTRISDGREVDSSYLAEGLSLDAVPTIVELLPTLDDATRRELLGRIGCPASGHGWAGWNRSRSAAVDALADDCLWSISFG